MPPQLPLSFRRFVSAPTKTGRVKARRMPANALHAVKHERATANGKLRAPTSENECLSS